MKDIINVINEEQQVNEGGMFSAFDLSLAVVIGTSLSYLVSMGFSITGKLIEQLIGSKNRDRHGKEKVEALQRLKDFSRQFEISPETSAAAASVLNNPGEWSTEMLSELRSALYKSLTPEQQAEYERLESEYIKERNKFVRLK